MNELIAFFITMRAECKKHKHNCYDCPFFENNGHNQPICNYFDETEGYPSKWSDDDIEILIGYTNRLTKYQAFLKKLDKNKLVDCFGFFEYEFNCLGIHEEYVKPFMQKMAELEDEAYCPHGFMVGCPTCTKKPIEPTFDV